MTCCFRNRAFWTIGFMVIAAGSMTLTPRQAAMAWSVGEPIITYWNYGQTLDLTPSIAQQAVDGGYNLVWTGGVSQLALAKQYGLRAQMALWMDSLPAVGTPQRTSLDAIIDWMRVSPAGYSYFLYDEPNASQFAGLHDIVNYLRQRDPNHLSYINLLPSYVFNSISGTSGYSAYVSQYITTVQPSMLSYDAYPFLTTGDRKEYLQNLGIISTAAQQAGIPFMNVVQADGNSNPIGTVYRVPNTNELRFQVYTTLAYGAQGINYFNYFNESSTPTGGGLKPNPDGTPTPVFTALTPLNKEFKNIAAQYQSLKLIGDYVKGYSTTTQWSWSLWQNVTTYNGPPGTTTLPSGSPFDISSVSNSMSYSDGAPLKGVLFGFFDKDGTTLADATLALIENLDYTASKTYTVTGPGNLSIFDATTGIWTPTGHNYTTLNLAPGGGVLVGLTSVVPEPSAIVLLGTGLGGLALCAWRKWK
jgi:hypothetical protein